MNNVIVLVLWILLGLYVINVIGVQRYNNRYMETCKGAGGISIITPKKNHCLNPSAFIELKEEK